jgi:pentatricopeptide repeat protein
LVAGFAMRGHGNEALEHFEQMCQEGVEPDHFCFSSISL